MLQISKKLNWSPFFLNVFIGIYFLLAPLTLSYFFEFTNPNNTSYNINVILTSFVKIAAIIILYAYLISFPFLILKAAFRKVLFLLFFIVIYFPSTLNFIHVLLFHSRANASSYYSIFASNKNESLEFIFNYTTPLLVVYIIAFLIIPYLAYFIHKKMPQGIKIGVVSLFLILFSASFYTAYTRSDVTLYQEISIFKLVKEYKAYKNEVSSLNDYHPHHLGIKRTSILEPETYIFIIGESTSKYHMQLYGYERETTPHLMKLKNELIIFNQVTSFEVHTVEAIKNMFVLADQENERTNTTLIDCFNEAGFSTFWLSNQAYLGEHDTPISAIAKRTLHQTYLNIGKSKKLDEELFPKLDLLLQEKNNKKVIFVHLMGTHFNYKNRYPHHYNLFTEKNISIFGEHADNYINQYDNAILYNDFIVSEIIKKAKNTKGVTAVISLSDHGDEVYDYRNFHGHSSAMSSKYMRGIPFYIWGNSQFNGLRKGQLSVAKNNSDFNFSLKNFSHSIQDLLDVKSIYYQHNKSYFTKRDVSTFFETSLDSTRKLTAPITFDFDPKIWVHRVNSLARLDEVQGIFKGLELDLVFENGKLDVRHPPDSSIHLSLHKFLSHVQHPSQHYFWLDIKNLTLENVEKVKSRLDYLTKKFNLKENIIVETTHPKTIPTLNINNYFTLYYLPDLVRLKPHELDQVQKNITTYRPTAISQSIENYYLMDEKFKIQNKLIWALNVDWTNQNNHSRIEALLKKDKTIKVCLVNYKTPAYR